MENLSEEQICEVAPEVGVPVVEKLAYVTNQELSEMYVELLAKASQTQEANAAHPSFANIIKEPLIYQGFPWHRDVPPFSVSVSH